MKNLESLKGNKFNMESVKGGALPPSATNNDWSGPKHMTASYVREGSAIDDWNNGIGEVFRKTGYSNDVDS